MTEPKILSKISSLLGSSGPESLTLVSKIFKNSEGGVYLHSEIIFSALCNDAVFRFYELQVTPQSLRRAADQLEREIVRVRKEE